MSDNKEAGNNERHQLGDELDAEIPEPLGQLHVLGLHAWLVQVTVAEVLPGHALDLRVECHIACSCRTLFKLKANQSEPQIVVLFAWLCGRKILFVG